MHQAHRQYSSLVSFVKPKRAYLAANHRAQVSVSESKPACPLLPIKPKFSLRVRYTVWDAGSRRWRVVRRRRAQPRVRQRRRRCHAVGLAGRSAAGGAQAVAGAGRRPAGPAGRRGRGRAHARGRRGRGRLQPGRRAAGERGRRGAGAVVAARPRRGTAQGARALILHALDEQRGLAWAGLAHTPLMGRRARGGL